MYETQFTILGVTALSNPHIRATEFVDSIKKGQDTNLQSRQTTNITPLLDSPESRSELVKCQIFLDLFATIKDAYLAAYASANFTTYGPK
jgi:hypothetical protein